MIDGPFTKMHGLGNDFVVFDVRDRAFAPSPASLRAVADRYRGVGCDQIVFIEPAKDAKSDIFMRIFNADGGEVSACGNAARCIGALMMKELDTDSIVIDTASGLISARRDGSERICVDMGLAHADWRDIPLAKEIDSLHLPIRAGVLSDPVGVGVGNPHAVFFVDDADAVDLDTLGPELEHHPLFPERTNVEVVQRLSAERLRMRVWERGAGLTKACGTGACAALVAAARRGLTDRRATVVLDGGPLYIRWLDSGHVEMTGPVATSFTGHLSADFFAGKK